MNRTAKDTAIVLAAMLKRSGQKRARVSGAVVKLISQRNMLRAGFVVSLAEEMEDLAWIFSELRGGGFGAIQTKALEAAKPVTPMRWLDEVERKALKLGTLDVEELASELASDDDEQALEAE